MKKLLYALFFTLLYCTSVLARAGWDTGGSGGGTFSGSGTQNVICKFTAVTTLGDSTISDNGTTVTITTGKNFKIGTTQWNSGDNIDGEAIKDNTIDEDSIDFTDITLTDFTFDVGNVSKTEFGYLDNATSNIQNQIDAKEDTLTNEAGLYSALSDVSDFVQPAELVGANEAYASGWDNDTSLPEKDDIYDYLHQIDTDDDGDVDNIDSAVAGVPYTGATSNVDLGAYDLTTDLLTLSDNRTFTWGASYEGVQFDAVAATFTESGPAGTRDYNVSHSFGIPTFATDGNSVTITDASTVYIAGPPAAGANMTITNAWPLNVATGNALFQDAPYIQKDVSDAVFNATYFTNLDDPDTGDTTQNVAIYAQTRSSEDSGVSFTTEHLGYFLFYKINDYWGANNSDQDGGLKYYRFRNGSDYLIFNFGEYYNDWYVNNYSAGLWATTSNNSLTTSSVGANVVEWGYNGFLLEGATSDNFELGLAFPTIDPNSDITSYIMSSKWATDGGAQGKSGLPAGLITETFHIRHDEMTAVATTEDITIVTLPARAVIKWPILIVVTEQGACCSGGDDTLTLSLGITAANYDDLIVDSNGEAAAGVIYGDDQAGNETGTNLDNAGAWYPGLMNSWTATTAVVLHVDTNAENVSTITAGEYDIVITYEVIPTYGE